MPQAALDVGSAPTRSVPEKLMRRERESSRLFLDMCSLLPSARGLQMQLT